MPKLRLVQNLEVMTPDTALAQIRQPNGSREVF